MTETVLDVRRRAAERARAVLNGTLEPDAFRAEFADVEDRAVAELLDLMDHEPLRAGLLSGGEHAYRNYQDSIREIIASLTT
jgi:hypothetical protein